MLLVTACSTKRNSGLSILIQYFITVNQIFINNTNQKSPAQLGPDSIIESPYHRVIWVKTGSRNK